MSDLSNDEVHRRMPTLRLISDPDIRHETARLTAAAPSYFWTVPASTSGFHNPLCRGERGLWVHTLMLSTVIERLAESRTEMGQLDQLGVDCAHAAAILHDQRKNGHPASPSETSVSDHDLRMAEVVREETTLPEAVWRAIESHMGPWYDGPEPDSRIEQLVHTADMLSSTESVTPAVHGPVPHELEHLDLEEVDLS